VPHRPPLLSIQNLSVAFSTRSGRLGVLHDISLTVEHGEALAIVGESGCGKSTLALAIVRYLAESANVDGQIVFDGHDLQEMSSAQLRRFRGKEIAFVYQDPMSCLDPVMTVGRQLMEVPKLHERIGNDEAWRRALAVLEEVRLGDAERIMSCYPHQLSGGQQQRIVLAMALIANPSLLILDEPTSGLDVTVEAAVLKLLRELRENRGTAMIFVTHNLNIISHLCDRIAVLYAGQIMELGKIQEVFEAPLHPYTKALLSCLPGGVGQGHRGSLYQIPGQLPSLGRTRPGCTFADRCYAVQEGRCTTLPIPLVEQKDEKNRLVRCVRSAELGPDVPTPARTTIGSSGQTTSGSLLEVRGLHKTYGGIRRLFASRRLVQALRNVNIAAAPGRTLAIVGESGCGKSTLARIISGLTQASGGQLLVDGLDISDVSVEHRPETIKKKIQMVFQNPESTLNPAHSAAFSIRRSLQCLRQFSRREARSATRDVLKQVQLPADIGNRMPRQLSGGQKQRVAIARALASDPRLIIADEPISALDVSVQAAILNLLSEAQAASGATLVLISHDLAVVRHFADDVAIMYLGLVVETGSVDEVFTAPYHPYTEALVAAAPRRWRKDVALPAVLEGSPPSLTKPVQGCVFSSRCPRIVGDICRNETPPEQRLHGRHRMFCHIPAEQLAALQNDIVPL
jgi:peptide/nickel transport system ATP-binding protein